MASIVRTSSACVGSREATVSSTRDLSYPIWTSDDTRVISVVFLCVEVVVFFEKSIDPLRSTMIFCAVFFPIPGTEERRVSSSNWMAFRRFSHPSPRRLSAVLPPIPLTFRSWRKRSFSSRSTNPKSVCPASLIWWCTHISDFSHMRIFAIRSGETSISSPRPVPSIRLVICIPSMERIFQKI